MILIKQFGPKTELSFGLICYQFESLFFWWVCEEFSYLSALNNFLIDFSLDTYPMLISQLCNLVLVGQLGLNSNTWGSLSNGHEGGQRIPGSSMKWILLNLISFLPQLFSYTRLKAFSKSSQVLQYNAVIRIIRVGNPFNSYRTNSYTYGCQPLIIPLPCHKNAFC